MLFSSENSELQPCLQVYQVACRFMLVWKKDRDKERFEKLCRYLVSSLESSSIKLSYVGVALNKEYAIAWIAHVKDVLWKCCCYLDELRPEFLTDMRVILLYLRTLVTFTSTNTWNLLRAKHMEVLKPGLNQLCANVLGHLFTKGFYLTLKSLLLRGLGKAKIPSKHVSVSAVLTLALRPLVSAGFTEKLMTMFLIHILSVPALILHIQGLAHECSSVLVGHNVFTKSLELLSSEQNMRIVFNTLEGNYALCLLANLIQLAYIQREDALKDVAFPAFTFVVTRLMESCQHYVVTKQSNLTYWHPVLGWFAQSMGHSLHEAMPFVKTQLYMLWSGPMVSLLLGQTLSELVENVTENSSEGPSAGGGSSNILKRALDHRSNRTNAAKHHRKLGSPECTKVALLCSLYQTALGTLTQLKLDILTGLCYQDKILYNLWLFLNSLGPNCGLKAFLDLLAVNTKCSAPEFQMLILFCDCMTHYVTILDDLEMYEQQKPFRLTDYVNMSTFLNHFLYKGVLGNLFDVKGLGSNVLFQSAHTLLMVLYRRDCRRSYTIDSHWIIKELRVGSFISDLEKGKKVTQVRSW
ncbi:hypothetical protein B7P43_G08820 [Cryptotermes secundus]|uniref:HECT-type E3 ubiquitin transferase n=1 Tax=Cryptotermes secundus TaxID=105785 RepID=A0A2J7RJK0_9NEOP|nr:hypothetical protein B7P43_G08820 [Cryptotermes secundus]